MERNENYYDGAMPNDEYDIVDMQGREGEADDVQTFYELLDILKKLIQSSRHLGKSVLIRTDNLDQIIAGMEANIPQAVQLGNDLYAKRDRVIDATQKTAEKIITEANLKATNAMTKTRNACDQMVVDADNKAKKIVEQAKVRADHMVSEEEIVRRAEEDAASIKNNARVESSEIILKARHEAYQIISRAEGEVEDMMQRLRSIRMNLNND